MSGRPPRRVRSACWVIPPWWMKPGSIAWFESKLIWPPTRWLSTLFDAENHIGNRCSAAFLIDSRPENFRADRAFQRHCHMPRYVTKAASTLRRKAFRRLCHLALYTLPFNLDTRRPLPQPLQVIKASCLLGKDVDHEIEVIHQNPLGFGVTFHVLGRDARLFQLLHDGIRYGLGVARRGPAANQEKVRKGADTL